jgi:hypothetical protein
VDSPDGEKSREYRNETRESDWIHSESHKVAVAVPGGAGKRRNENETQPRHPRSTSKVKIQW